MLGALLSLGSAALFGLNVALLRRGVLTGSVLQALAITVPVGVPLFLVGCLAVGAMDAFYNLSASAWFWYSVAGVVHFLFGRYANYRTVQLLGAAQSAPIIQLSLVVSLVLAFALLGESITLLQAVGIVLILVGPLVLLRERRKRGEVRTRAGQRLEYLSGYFWGVMCAIGFGASPVLIRFGLDVSPGADRVAEGMAGGLASYIAGTAVLALLVLPLGGLRGNVLDMGGKEGRFFLAAGVLVFLSQLLLYVALALAPVAVVTAVQRTALFFRVLFGWIISPDHEVLGASILAGIAISALGVLFVTVSGEQIATVVPLPAAIVDIGAISWP